MLRHVKNRRTKKQKKKSLSSSLALSLTPRAFFSFPALGRKLAAAPARRVVTKAKQKTYTNSTESFRQNLGYTEKDSAGQSNIFAVEPQVYVQGKGENTVASLAVTVIAFAGAFGLGYTLIAREKSVVDPDLTFLYESGQTLSSYEKKFAPPPPAPKIVQAVVEAPAPAVEEAPAPEAPAPVAPAPVAVEEAAAM